MGRGQREWSGLLHAVINLTLHVPLLPVHDRLRRWIASALSFERSYSLPLWTSTGVDYFHLFLLLFHDDQFEKGCCLDRDFSGQDNADGLLQP